jgi:hypothetical protein
MGLPDFEWRTDAMGFGTSRPGKTGSLLLVLLMLSATGGCKQSAWPLWDAYKSRFIDAQGRVIDHTAGDRTTSEGEAYAMFFALAGNDRATFDRLLGWTQVNLAGNDLAEHLPSAGCGARAKAANGRRSTQARPRTPMPGWRTPCLKQAGCGSRRSTRTWGAACFR